MKKEEEKGASSSWRCHVWAWCVWMSTFPNRCRFS